MAAGRWLMRLRTSLPTLFAGVSDSPQTVTACAILSDPTALFQFEKNGSTSSHGGSISTSWKEPRTLRDDDKPVKKEQ